MKILYFFTLFFVIGFLTIGFASAEEITVSLPEGSGVPGCEETNECYIPFEVTVHPGDTVVWSNDDVAAHTVTSGVPPTPDGTFDSGIFMAGTTFSHTFDTLGQYDYYCIVHPWMIGEVIVQSIGNTNSPDEPEPTHDQSRVTIVPAQGSASPGCEETVQGCYLPQVVTVNVGDSVIFSNTDRAAHTWTSGSLANGVTGHFDTGLLMVDNSYEWVPDTTGEIIYFCMVHPWMEGLIIVQEAGSSSPHQVPVPVPLPQPSETDRELQIENDRLKSENQDLKMENKRLKNQINSLTSEVSELKDQIVSMTGDFMDMLKQQLDWFRTQL